MILSVTFDQASLSLADLTIANTSDGSYWLPEGGIDWPRLGRRKTRAEASPYLDGPGALLARVKDGGLFPLTVYATATTMTALDAKMTALQDAVDQWVYDLTLVAEDSTRVYEAECCDDEIAWGEIDSGMIRGGIVRGSVVIPIRRRLS